MFLQLRRQLEEIKAGDDARLRRLCKSRLEAEMAQGCSPEPPDTARRRDVQEMTRPTSARGQGVATPSSKVSDAVVTPQRRGGSRTCAIPPYEGNSTPSKTSAGECARRRQPHCGRMPARRRGSLRAWGDEEDDLQQGKVDDPANHSFVDQHRVVEQMDGCVPVGGSGRQPVEQDAAYLFPEPAPRVLKKEKGVGGGVWTPHGGGAGSSNTEAPVVDALMDWYTSETVKPAVSGSEFD